MPHPIRLFGNTIAWCEGRLNSGVLRRLKGGGYVVCSCGVHMVAFYDYSALSESISMGRNGFQFSVFLLWSE